MKQFTWLAIGLCLLLTLGSFVYAHQICPRTAYVDLTKVYDQFLLKKDYENKLRQLNVDTQYLLDSLQHKLELQLEAYHQKATTAQQQKIEHLQRELMIKQQRINEDKEELVVQYDQQVWTQLNQFVQEYSARQEYDYLFGATGNGNIMGRQNNYDVTSQVIHFVNQRYQGYEH